MLLFFRIDNKIFMADTNEGLSKATSCDPSFFDLPIPSHKEICLLELHIDGILFTLISARVIKMALPVQEILKDVDFKNFTEKLIYESYS